MAHRSPARWLAPLALVVCVVAAFAVVQDGTSDSDDGPSTTPAATSTSRTKTTAGKSGSSSAKHKRTYTVKSGDVLSSIAEAHGTTVDELLTLNPSVNASSLRVGQKLRLPR